MDTALTPGTLIKLAGVKAPVVVVETHESDCYTVSGPRGQFLLTNCKTHWVRWPTGPRSWHSAAPRECAVEWTKPPADA